MNNQTFLTILDIIAELALAATYLGSAFIAFMILKQDKVKEGLDGFSKIIIVVIFIIITQLLYSAGASFINTFVYFPRRLIVGDSLIASVRCLGSVLALAGLIFGCVTLLRANGKDESPEELNGK